MLIFGSINPFRFLHPFILGGGKFIGTITQWSKSVMFLIVNTF